MDFTSYREPVAEKIRVILPRFLKPLRDKNRFAEDIEERLLDYALRGKLIRGSLVPFAYYSLSGREVHEDSVFTLGAVMEVFQSMLLIHDDIMDQDDLRRGKPSIHAQYRDLGRNSGIGNPPHYGVSMGICAGDVAAFAAFGGLAGMAIDDSVLRMLLEFISREMVLVGMAQMQDVHHGHVSAAGVNLEAILNTYRYKTGRYTFSLPLSLGALLRGADEGLRNSLEELGEELGIVFQIKDDEIGLLGVPENTGKPNDSDLAEGKKTVYMQKLMEALSGDERVRLESILKSYGGEEDYHWVQAKLMEHSVAPAIEQLLENHVAQCRGIINSIPQNHDRLIKGLHFLVDYNIGRKY